MPIPNPSTPSFAQRNALTLKVVIITVLTLLLLIPVAMISGLVREREARQDSVADEISGKWGGAQTLTGPLLILPYQDRQENIVRYLYFLPDDLVIDAELFPEKRSRTFYETVVYNSKIHVQGTFKSVDPAPFKIQAADLRFNDASIMLGINDLRGIEEQITFNWNDYKNQFNSGTTGDLVRQGVNVKIPLSNTPQNIYNFSFDLVLKGSRNLNFTPIGKETVVNVKAKWDDPSFNGAFLPDNRTITKDSFSANWKVLHLNRSYPQAWASYQNHRFNESDFGVNLLLPVDHYAKTGRTVKYAILLISLTFMVYFFLEMLTNIGVIVHPLQYLLIGLALCIFYALLLSFTEHVSFNIAYFLAGFMTIGLITLYSKSIFQTWKNAGLIGGVLTTIYLFVFVIVQLVDYSLLIGSLGLFFILAIVMYASRKIDWKNMEQTMLNSTSSK